MTEIAEVVDSLERLHSELQDLLVRGLRVCGPEHLSPLRSLQNELKRIGASHLAGRLTALIGAIETDDRQSASFLLRTQASLRVFERVLTLRVAADCLEEAFPASGLESDGEGDETE
jgi:hypothetical protein